MLHYQDVHLAKQGKHPLQIVTKFLSQNLLLIFIHITWHTLVQICTESYVTSGLGWREYKIYNLYFSSFL
jgi:hypothetical protein